MNQQSQHTSPADEPAPLFKPFGWVRPQDQADTGRYAMLSTIRDLASGVALALQLVERSELQKETGDAPIIDGADAKRFTRMSVAAMHVIEEFVDDHFDEMQDNAAVQRRLQKDGAR